MAGRAAHLAQARLNRAHAEHLLASNPNDAASTQWAVTAAFYCAMHCIEAHLATHGTTSRSHQDRDQKMLDPRFGIPASVRATYLQLYRYSRGARYYMQQFTAGWVRAVILDRYLRQVTDFVGL